MFRLSRSALLVAALSMAGGVLTPGAAYAADTTTNLSATQMAAALKTVATASTAAADGGLRTDLVISDDTESGSGSFVVDPSHGVSHDRLRFAGTDEDSYAVAGKGYFHTLPDRASRAAVKMMGRPTVKYAFTPDRSLTLAEHLEQTPAPASLLSEGVDHAGTRTVHDDGSADYVQVVEGQKITLRVGPAGTLSGAQVQYGSLAVTVTYTYAPQKITLPAASTVISEAQLTLGVWYLQMPADVKYVSHTGAANARRAARGATVQVASLRKAVRREVSAFNTKAQLKMIKVKDVRRGVRVYATNPWTHRTVAYTVTASGKKVVVRS
ncbi:hypothetical protein [Couchioplanes azureus]|uniref:hypothetical protein n=1 Tax=Couchioplanes caeruleus TaxID=56438 RepID=UPI001670AB1B|nr:hypothetical protein [Couchioplanes caeruleus]GGQ72647.1 hypothetical protein GCM10010166_48280 [Couchioplanes caeruleus subsp. azureus]